MNILKWFEFLPEDLWNIMVCLAHEQGKENEKCYSLRQAIEILEPYYRGTLEYSVLDDLLEFIFMDLSKDYRLISEKDWELLERLKSNEIYVDDQGWVMVPPDHPQQELLEYVGDEPKVFYTRNSKMHSYEI